MPDTTPSNAPSEKVPGWSEMAPRHLPSGVWYCRKHCGTVNEDQAHDVDDMCPWSTSNLNDNGRPYDPCDWTELLYEAAS